MLSTTDRYLIKELGLTILATVLVFVAMELSHRLAVYLSDAASGKLARSSIFLLLGLHAIRYLVVVVPPAALLGMMLALGRLYRDNEMTVMRACGLGPGAVYRPLFVVVVPLALAMAGLSLFVVPLCMELQQELQLKAQEDAEISIVQPGVFRSVLGGKHVIYVNEIVDDGKELRDVFIQSHHPDGLAVTTGARGYQQVDPVSGARYLVLRDGYRYLGNPGESDFRMMEFERLAILVEGGSSEEARIKRESIPTAELWSSDDPGLIAELHTRFGGPMSVLMIALIAPLVAHANPREGRYGRVVAAILIYLIYTNLMGIGEAWLKHETVPALLGLWWVHASLGLLALVMWLRLYGRRVRKLQPGQSADGVATE